MKLDENKKTVCVIFGGVSPEHDISIITGVQTLHALDENRFNILPIYISKEGKFILNKDFFDISLFSKLDKINGNNVSFLPNGKLFVTKGKKGKELCHIDFAFLSLHGGGGEGGEVQGLLDCVGIPYSCAGVLGSAISQSKTLTKDICSSLNIPQIKYVTIFENEKDDYLSKIKDLTYPLIVKPATLGSSIGITICKDENDLKDALSFAFLFDKEVIIEQKLTEFVELNMSFIGNSFQVENSSVEDVTNSEAFLSFEDKYLGGNKKGMENLNREIVEIDSKIYQKMVEYGKSLFKHLSLKGVVRIDYLLDKSDNTLYVNEINSIPGSMANYLWQGKYTFRALLNKVYDLSIEERNSKNKKITEFSSSVLSSFSSAPKIFINK